MSRRCITPIAGVRAYEEYLLKHTRDKVIVLVFSANWCEPCKQLIDILQRQRDIPELSVGYVDVNAHPDNGDLAEDQFRVSGLPTIVFVRVGSEGAVKVLHRMEGFPDPDASWREFVRQYSMLTRHGAASSRHTPAHR